MQQIANGDADIIVAGGQESMSMAPHAAHMRSGTKMGDFKLVDTMLKDGLLDAFHGYHMGNTAENVAQRWQLTREDQDAFAVASQNKAEAAQKGGRFKDEITPFTISTRKGDVTVDQDEYIRPGTTMDTVSKLRAFSKDGTVTAANASGINDGGAALVLMTEAEAEKRGLTPLARIASRDRRRRPGDHGHGPDPGLPQGARESRLEGAGPRSRRGERGVRGPGARRQQGHGLGSVDRERERRRHRHRPSDRRLGRPRSRHAPARDAETEREKGARDLCIGGGMGVAMCVER